MQHIYLALLWAWSEVTGQNTQHTFIADPMFIGFHEGPGAGGATIWGDHELTGGTDGGNNNVNPRSIWKQQLKLRLGEVPAFIQGMEDKWGY